MFNPMGYYLAQVARLWIVEHRASWWGSLVVTYVFQLGAYQDWESVRRLINGLGVVTVPDFPAVWWLAIPFLLWTLASLTHNEIRRRDKRPRIVFDAPECVTFFVNTNVRAVTGGPAFTARQTLVTLVRINVRNCPVANSPDARADKAYTTITIRKHGAQGVLKSVDYGRWTDNPAPGYEEIPSHLTMPVFRPEWSFRSLEPNGSKNSNDLLLSFHDAADIDSPICAFNGECQNNDRWFDPNMVLEGSEFDVQIRVYATGLPEPALEEIVVVRDANRQVSVQRKALLDAENWVGVG